VDVFFVDPPGKPGELESQETTEDSITLAWEPPTETGGRPINGYIVEQREIGSSEIWTRYITSFSLLTFVVLP